MKGRIRQKKSGSSTVRRWTDNPAAFADFMVQCKQIALRTGLYGFGFAKYMPMILVQYVGMAWACTCVLFIMMSLKLENQVTYSWFVTFIPRFVLCVFDMVWVIARLVYHKRSYGDPQSVSMKRKGFLLASCILELLFEILLCLRLDHIVEISLYYVLIPLWILLAGYVANFFHFQIVVIQS